MANILRQRDIIDRRALGEALALAIGDAPASTLDRKLLLPPLKAALARGRAEIRRRFDADGTADREVREQCFLVDQVIRGHDDLRLVGAVDLFQGVESAEERAFECCKLGSDAAEEFGFG